ncbi:MAG: hypothetical protein GY719_42275 [bacterium]|nr:hypothetical protein [bacterium]
MKTCLTLLVLVLAVPVAGAEEAMPVAGVEEVVLEPPSKAADECSPLLPAVAEGLAPLLFEFAEPTVPAATNCTISVDCDDCGLVPVTCSGPTGTCFSGGSGCNEWVQCGGNPKDYCEPPSGGGGDPVPECPKQGKSCSQHSDCRVGGGECNFCRCFSGTCGCP